MPVASLRPCSYLFTGLGITSQRTLREYTNGWTWKLTRCYTDTELAQQ